MSKPRRFYKPKIIAESRHKMSCINLEVGDIIINDSFVDKLVYVRWPNGHEEAVKVDYACFPENDCFIYKPCILVDLHGITLFVDLSAMKAIKIPK